MKQICIGILAHVDAGKTTLSEALLYRAGAIRRLGRVDHQDAFLDTDAMERQRGITIFSKQAVLELGETRVTLLDTPGHVDFSAEMERTLQVLDCAVLVISGTDGVQGHTRTLWDLLERYQVPTFLFINKMDLAGADRTALLAHLKNKLSGGCVDFGDPDTLWEEAAVCDEAALEQYLETGELPEDMISRLIGERKLFPCYFGSALKVEGVDALLAGVERYAPQPAYPAEFGAKVFKITRDAQGARLTHMKITGGALHTKELLTGREGDTVWQEKADQLRLYSGSKFHPVDTAEAGAVVAVTGLSHTFPGQGLGIEPDWSGAVLQPVLTYRVELTDGTDPHTALQKLRQLEEEDPQLHIVWNNGEIHAQLMGEVQMEVLQRLVRERMGMEISFGAGAVCYRETIANAVEGIGHFEPLRHYAEVHLLLEPGEPGQRHYPRLRVPHGQVGSELAAADLYTSVGKTSFGGTDWLAHHRYQNHLVGGPRPRKAHRGRRFPTGYLPGRAAWADAGGKCAAGAVVPVPAGSSRPAGGPGHDGLAADGRKDRPAGDGGGGNGSHRHGAGGGAFGIMPGRWRSTPVDRGGCPASRRGISPVRRRKPSSRPWGTTRSGTWKTRRIPCSAPTGPVW